MTSQTIGTARVDIVANADSVEVATTKAKNSIARMSKEARAEYDSLTKRQQRSIDTEIRRIETMNLSREGQRAYNVALKTTGALQQDLLSRIRENTVALDQQGLSAKQMAFAMRGVPAQITDIVVSLQGGQRPMTVLLQQGGQLKDMFGGIVPAAKALGATVLGMVNPVTMAAAAVTAVGSAWYQGSRELDEYNKHLTMTGNAIGVTSGEISSMAARLDDLSGATRGGAVKVLTEVATSGRIAGAQIEQVSRIALEASSLLGKEVSTTVEEFAKLGDDPVKAVLELNEKYHFLTTSVYEQIKALDEEGRSQDAATLAQDTYAQTTKQRLQEVRENLGLLEKSWNGVWGAAKDAWDVFAGIGRPKTLDELQKKLDKATSRLKELQERSYAVETDTGAFIGYRGIKTGGAQNTLQAEIDSLQKEIAGLQEEKAEAAAAHKEREEQLQRQEQQKTLNSLLQDGRTKRQIQEDEIDAEKKRWESSSSILKAGTAEYEKYYQAHLNNLKNIEEKYKDKGRSRGVSAAQSEVARLQARLAEEQNLAKAIEQNGAQISRSNEFERRASQLRNLAATETKAVTKAEQLRLAVLNEQVGAQVRANKAAEEAVKERTRYLDGLEKSVKQTKDEAQKIRDQAETMGLSKSALEDLTTARLRDHAAQLQGKAGFEDELKLVREQIAAREDLAAAISERDIAKTSYDTQQKSIRDWEQTVEKYNDVFRDGFAVMLNKGGSDWKSWSKSLVTTFKTTVADQLYKLFAQPIVAKVALSVSGLLGTGGVTLAAGKEADGSALGGLGAMGWLTNFGGSVVDTTYNLGMKLMSMDGIMRDFGGTLLENAATIGQVADFAGNVLGYGSSIYQLTQGNWGAGLGGAAGQFFGGPIGSFIGSQLGGLIDKALKGETRVGGGFHYDPTSSKTSFGDGPSGGYGGDATLSAVDSALKAQHQGIQGLYDALGIQNIEIASILGSFESSEKGRGGTSSGGQIIIDGQVRYFGSLTDEGHLSKGAGYGGKSGTAEEMFANLQKELAFSALEAWQITADQLPKTISSALSDVDIRALSAEQAQAMAAGISATVQEVTQLTAALNELPFKTLHDLSYDLTESLKNAAGGTQQFITSVSSYYQGFHSEEERQRDVLQQLTKQMQSMNYEMPTTKDGFRALVESLDATDEANHKTIASLYGMSDKLASYYEWQEQQTQAVIDRAKESSQAVSAAASDIARSFTSATASIQSSIGGLSERIMLDIMKDDGERYDYYKQQFDRYASQLSTSTDMEQIQDLVSKMNSAASNAYGLLTEDVRKGGKGQEFLEVINSYESVANRQLLAGRVRKEEEKAQELKTTSTAIAKEVAAEMLKILNGAGDVIGDAGRVLNGAAGGMSDAVQSLSYFAETLMRSKYNEVN